MILVAACLVGCTETIPPAAEESAPPTAAVAPPPVRADRPRAARNPVKTPPPPATSIDEPVPLPPAPERAMKLFATHCVVCHGERGLGDGPAAAHLVPRPWSFQGGYFKWGTTATAMTSDADILRVLRRGVPGTTMPPHADLAEDDLRELVAAVRHLALAATAARIREADPERSGADVLKCAQDLVAPGGPVTIPPRPVAPASAATTGFERKCRECHGSDGTGRDAIETNQKDAMGSPISPRDLTRDALRGGESELDIATRMARGVPGTPMPVANLTPAEFWDVVDSVRRLRANVDPDAAVERRATISVRRAATLPTSPTDPAWAEAPQTRAPLMPLRHGADVPTRVDVRALCDGRRVAVRVEWRGRGDAAAGAAVRLLADAAGASPFVDGGSGVVARWNAAERFTSAASPPRYVPLSEVAASVGRGVGERVERGWAVVLDVGVLDGAKLDIVVGVWDGVAADGRLLEGTTIRHALDVAR
jgi:mono/diheme cytochrome c family protein